MSSLLNTHLQNRKLNTLIENRTIYSAKYAELNIFETYKVANKVELTFDFPVIASMLTGKKVMHLKDRPAFDFYPGESVVLPSNEKMTIDFPLATLQSPTQCLALGIDSEKINDVVCNFNQKVAIENENNSWSLDKDTSHLTNNKDVNYLISRILHTFTANNNTSKDILIDLMLQELIVRLLQTKARSVLLNDIRHVFSDTRIGMVVKYIKQHLTNKDLTVDILAEKACMSISHFHKKFKNTLGVSPIDYINSEKIKFAKKIIKERNNFKISEIAYLSGFNSVSYFNRQFKKMELMTPQQFKMSISQ